MPTIISSLSHPLVKHFVKLRKDSAYRKEKNSCLIMGKSLCEELLQNIEPLCVLDQATEAVFKKITSLPSPDPYVAEFPLPEEQKLDQCEALLVIDQVADPGNLGTILRTALALGWKGVYFLPNCVDPFNDKVLRSSKAALFRLPYQRGSFEELKEMSNGFTPLVADLEGESLDQIVKPKKPLLVLSHEASGVSKEFETFGTKVTIPIQQMESLNVAVAGGILMHGLWKTI